MSAEEKSGKKMRTIAVLRPKDPELALRLTEEWKKKGATEEDFQQILQAQEYTFEGLLGPGGTLLHPETREKVGKLIPGDSIVSMDDLSQLGKAKLN